MRHDSLNHIFDSLAAFDNRLPSADRPTPGVLQQAVAMTRSNGNAYIGNLAERMGHDIECYAAIGYDLTLGDEMLQPINRAVMEQCFQVALQLQKLNAGLEYRRSVTFCVDTHNTGEPYFWGEPLVRRAGARRMRQRHFVARFTGAGACRRPKCEAMGSQDLSYGLYEATIHDVNLVWVGDEAYNWHYHRLEDIYDKLRPQLATGRIDRWVVTDMYAWWVIQSEDAYLIPIVSLDIEGDDPDPSSCVYIDLSEIVAYTSAEGYIYGYDLVAHPLCLSTSSGVFTNVLPFLEYRLLVIYRNGG